MNAAAPNSPTRVECIPGELKRCAQWVCWRSELRGCKATKIPFIAITGAMASSIDPATWCDFVTALAAGS